MSSQINDCCVTATSTVVAFTTVSAAPVISNDFSARIVSRGKKRSKNGKAASTSTVIANSPFQPKYSLTSPPTIGPSPKAMALPDEIIAMAAPLRSTGT
ncbi:hypothetical protein D1872_295030 [compost metagenome]